jgi:hypothetical protein
MRKELYKEEVKELTELMRTEWQEIQEIVKNQHLYISKTFLLGFIESEDDTEIGLLCTEQKNLLRFEKRSNSLNVEIVTKENIKNEFLQVTVIDEIENS